MAEKTNVNANVKTEKVWTPNATQKDFMDTLKNYENGATLTDIAIDTGKAFKPGALNVLVAKGLVVAEDSVRVADVMYRGVKIAEKKDTVKRYRLA